MGLRDSNTRRIITVTHPTLTFPHHAPCKLTTPPQSSNPQFLSHSRIPSQSLCLEMLIFCLVKIPSPNIYTHSDAAIIESRVCNQTVLVQVTPGGSTSPDCLLTPDQRCQVQLYDADCKGSKINFRGKTTFALTSSLPFGYTLGGVSCW